MSFYWAQRAVLCPTAASSNDLDVCVVGEKYSVCVCVCGCVSCSWRCGDSIQVLHKALEVGHLLSQLVGLIALRERNRVTARGRRRAGGEGGKHLEEARVEKRGKQRRRGSVFCRG